MIEYTVENAEIFEDKLAEFQHKYRVIVNVYYLLYERYKGYEEKGEKEKAEKFKKALDEVEKISGIYLWAILAMIKIISKEKATKEEIDKLMNIIQEDVKDTYKDKLIDIIRNL